ncbi:MAG: hypothetical protein E6Q36_08120 [Chryseobacterium sp.]|nr:MAG: hypothetical protein E6Q36_08120 [Chryseobacterium sp.]
MSVIVAVTLIFLQDFILLPRLQSINKIWMAPVATKTIGSTSQDHLNRGSVLAIDWTAYSGSYVYPPADSKVIYVGCNNAGGYGCWYLLEDKYGYRHILAHFSPNTLQFKTGDIVRQSDVLGTVARTGITSWYHVHWELSKNGQRLPLERYFDFSKMNYAKVHDVNSQPTKWNLTVSTMPNVRLHSFVWWLLALFILWWLWTPKQTIIAIPVAAFGLVFFLTTWLYFPLFLVNDVTNVDSVPASDKFAFTYKFIQRWEGTGNKCVHDPVRTMNGVTQASYNSYRRSKGLGVADVCRELSVAQAKEIYYNRFYKASGADALPLELALQTFDMAVNAGVGVAVDMRQQCGNDYMCYIDYRAAFYRSAKNCRLYCKAWFNRLNDTTKYLK